jgi:hypothetical protein|eukprot:COSAG01_NODE_3050_length_6663_cov_4.316118_3_plen_79_part_00
MVKECNGRGSQHIHMLLYGSVMPMFVSNVASIPRLRGKYLAALETQVRACVSVPVSVCACVCVRVYVCVCVCVAVCAS